MHHNENQENFFTFRLVFIAFSLCLDCRALVTTRQLYPNSTELRTTPNDSERLRTTPNDSERLRTTQSDSELNLSS